MEAHRGAVRDAAIDAAAALIAAHGLPAVTMSRIAQDAGIGRATLYKYFSDVEAVLEGWHQRQVHGHLALLAQASGQPGTSLERLRAVLVAYAGATRREHGGDLASLLHQGEHVVAAQQHLRAMVAGLVAEAAAAGEVRDDVDPAELATYCLHALTAAGALDSDAAVGRLVDVTTAGLRQPPDERTPPLSTHPAP
jgi:AcrR family transcriptional regulator